MGHPFDGFDVLVHRGKSELDMDQGTLLIDGQMLSLMRTVTKDHLRLLG